MAEAEPEAAMPVAPVEFTPPPAPLPSPASVPVVLPMRAPAVPPPPPAVVSLPEPTAETDGLPRLKLKPLPANLAGAEASSPVLSDTDTRPLPPAATMKPLSVIKTDAPVPPHLSAPGVLGEVLVSPPRVAFKPPARASRLSLSRMVIVVGGLLVLGGGGYYAHLMFFTAPPAPPAPVLVVNKNLPPPATMVAPAIISPAAVLPQKAVAQPTPAAPTAQTPVIKVAVKPAPPAPSSPPPPSTEFLTWVDAVKISGVFNGASPRAIINGLLVRPGDTIDAARGIVFDHLDPVRQEFFFRERSGAMTSKPY